MHWIEKFRREYVNSKGEKGLSREELAEMVRKKGVGCSAALIGILEDQNRGVTHSNIANKIAEVCGATPEQRDSIVPEIYRGGWKRPKKKLRKEFKVPPEPLSVGVIPETTRAVVQLDTAGAEVRRFISVREAAQAAGCATASVSNRCNRKLSGKTNEFFAFDCTWRFADEWDGMPPMHRVADMLVARGRTGKEFEVFTQ